MGSLKEITRKAFILLFSAVTLFAGPFCTESSGFESEGSDLTQYSLEELMNINITSVSKKSQQISEAAAAVFVITHEDIRRSGATTIPDALRMVPGLQVAKIDANKWAISARGSNGRFANKLLVLMDGRSVYTPLYSGVFWENLDTVLEDIDRIEVIRGPGASLWGANAVNGVINIITRSAGETQGGLVSGLAGTEEREAASLRYGAMMGADTPFRVYAKGFSRDNAVDEHGDATGDDWRYLRGGFRLDHHRGSRDLYTFQGDIYDGTNGETISLPTGTPPYSNTFENDHKEKGGNLLARWTRTLSSISEISLQAYYDYNKHILHLGTNEADIFDVEFQHRFPLGQYQDVTWGIGYRLYKDDFISVPALTLITPAKRDLKTYNAFLQDEISFFDKSLRLILGSKFEYNDFTHGEVQPNARLLWRPNERHSLWTSVARAVRTPSRVERDSAAYMSVIPPPAMGPEPVSVVYFGTDAFDSERLTAYEIGYRIQATSDLALDTVIFCHDYKGLRQTVTGTPFMTDTSPNDMILPVTSTNELDGEVYGLELVADWHPADWIRLQPGYTYMENKINYRTNDILTSQDPRYQVSLRTSLDLPWKLELDLWYRYVDELSAVIDGYHTIDTRFGWNYNDYLAFSIVGQNLLDSRHPEFQPEALHTIGTEVERGVYGQVIWRFN